MIHGVGYGAFGWMQPPAELPEHLQGAQAEQPTKPEFTLPPGFERDPVRDKQSAISQKLFRGARLTDGEKQFLRKHDPDTYAKANMIEIEQRCFDKALKRTKNKAQRKNVLLRKTMSILSGFGRTRYGIDANSTVERLNATHRTYSGQNRWGPGFSRYV